LHRSRIVIKFSIELDPDGDLDEYPFQAHVAAQKHGLGCMETRLALGTMKPRFKNKREESLRRVWSARIEL
jgi:hypothetical protein